MTPPAIVIGLDSVTGLQLTRVLAGYGVRVIGLVADRHHWAARTRRAARVVEVDHASEALVELLTAGGGGVEPGSVLLPCTDASVLLVAAHASQLAGAYRFADPGLVAIETLSDKAAFARLAAELGVPTPRWAELTASDDPAAAVSDLELPCVVKPARKDARWLREAPEKAIRVDDRGELVGLLARALEWSDHLLVQEWITGSDSDLVTCNCYIAPDGTVQAAVVSQKRRQWPPSTGVGTSAVTVDDPEVVELTTRLLAAVSFTGLGYVEFKRDADRGRLVAVEANVGRPTGRSVIAEAAGVELHHAHYADLAGVPRPALAQPEAGVLWLHLRREVQAALHDRRRGRLTLRDWLRSLRGHPRRFAVADLRDPAPFVLDLLATGRKQLPGLRRRPVEPTRAVTP